MPFDADGFERAEFRARTKRVPVPALAAFFAEGEPVEFGEQGAVLAKRVKALTDKPVLMGFGVSTPEQAVEVSAEADGAIVGTWKPVRARTNAISSRCSDAWVWTRTSSSAAAAAASLRMVMWVMVKTGNSSTSL